jgi:NAD(P)-dependent dehydrogenase (short-subunit alcohol dehydrogenase family)
MGTLQDQVAIITGGAMGIGGATARRLAGEGARVLIADFNLETAQANAERIRSAGGVAEVIQADVSQGADIKAMVDRAVELWGQLHILVNNAWGAKDSAGSAVELSESAWDYAMAVMVKAIFMAVKHAVPHMQQAGHGSIVNISSVHGLLMAPRALAYEAAKSAVIGLTRQMAIDFGPLGIRVNAICPGHIVTERMQQRRWDHNPSLLPFFEAQYPVRRVGRPDDIANAIRFLCSDEASFITGHALVVDGGLSIQLQENLGINLARFYRDHPEINLPD